MKAGEEQQSDQTKKKKMPKRRVGSLVANGIATMVGRVMEEKIRLERLKKEGGQEIVQRKIVTTPSGKKKRGRNEKEIWTPARSVETPDKSIETGETPTKSVETGENPAKYVETSETPAKSVETSETPTKPVETPAKPMEAGESPALTGTPPKTKEKIMKMPRPRRSQIYQWSWSKRRCQIYWQSW